MGHFRIVKRYFRVQRIKYQVLGTNKSLDPTQVDLGINEFPVPIQWDLRINTPSGLMHNYLRMQILRSISVRPSKNTYPDCIQENLRIDKNPRSIKNPLNHCKSISHLVNTQINYNMMWGILNPHIRIKISSY